MSKRQLASGDFVEMVALESMAADVGAGRLASVEVTLSSTPDEVTVVDLPDWARGLRMYPDTPLRFAIDESPEAIGTETGPAVEVDDWAVGGIAHADEWEVRLLPVGSGRTLRLASAEASAVVELEAWG